MRASVCGAPRTRRRDQLAALEGERAPITASRRRVSGARVPFHVLCCIARVCLSVRAARTRALALARSPSTCRAPPHIDCPPSSLPEPAASKGKKRPACGSSRVSPMMLRARRARTARLTLWSAPRVVTATSRISRPPRPPAAPQNSTRAKPRSISIRSGTRAGAVAAQALGEQHTPIVSALHCTFCLFVSRPGGAMTASR